MSVLAKSELPSQFASDEARRRAELDIARKEMASEVFSVKQVHGVEAVEIGPDSRQEGLYFSEADAVFTSRRGVALMVRTADCLPLFFVGQGPGRVTAGIIHAGWRGLADGIIRRTLERAAAGITHLTLVPGPCISGKNYEVGPEVGERFARREEKHTPAGRKYHVDLIENAVLDWTIPGVQIELIDGFRGCTVDENDRYFSHRKGDTGRNLNLIQIEE